MNRDVMSESDMNFQISWEGTRKSVKECVDIIMEIVGSMEDVVFVDVIDTNRSAASSGGQTNWVRFGIDTSREKRETIRQEFKQEFLRIGASSVR